MLITDDQLKQLILSNGVTDEKTLEKIIDFAQSSGISLHEALTEKDIISDQNLGSLIAAFLKIPFVILSGQAIPENIASLIPERIARRQKVIPFAADHEGIKLAMADPANQIIIATLEKKTAQKIIPFLATERDINNTLHIYKKDIQNALDKLLKQEENLTEKMTITEAPISKIVDLLFDYAYQYKASDIHIEPQEKNSLIRFRIDGILHDMLYLPKSLHDRIATRIKVLARLRTDEHLSPQDGKIRAVLDEETLDLRVSIIPIADGEKVVLRLLSTKSGLFSLSDLGMNETDFKKVTSSVTKSYGMILSTGPTGSGKTTTIYAILKMLHTREKNITTIEDPIEYRIKGVNQIQENPKTNLSFAQGLRSILRQDPNIIFVGEIRDSETAGIAVNAALTGHLVLSTLHTNDAGTALPRLIDMKVEPYLVASTVNLIIAQRLVRKICDRCKTAIELNYEDLIKNIPRLYLLKTFGEVAKITIYKGSGCKTCHDTGYQGRIGIFEVLEINTYLRKLITNKADSDVLEKEACNLGMTAMMEDGLEKVKKGLTSIEEVLRTTKVEMA